MDAEERLRRRAGAWPKVAKPRRLCGHQEGGDKKKKAKPTYQKGKDMSGPKQRGSDAKYQGE